MWWHKYFFFLLFLCHTLPARKKNVWTLSPFFFFSPFSFFILVLKVHKLWEIEMKEIFLVSLFFILLVQAVTNISYFYDKIDSNLKHRCEREPANVLRRANNKTWFLFSVNSQTAKKKSFLYSYTEEIVLSMKQRHKIMRHLINFPCILN